jgi:hypothetical protein
MKRGMGMWMAVCVLLSASYAFSGVVINELYIDPPGTDSPQEFIELRGDPNMSLDGYYLIFLEGEDSLTDTESEGKIQNIFDLSGQTLGSNGFLSIRMRANPYPVENINPNAMNLVQSSDPNYGSGFGSGSDPNSINKSSVGHIGEANRRDIENGIWTCFLINTHGGQAPVILQDLDLGGDGLDPLPSGWEIVDGIGCEMEVGESNGRFYAMVNFGSEFVSRAPAGAVVIDVNWGLNGVNDTEDDEIEYLARWGNSTGQTADDWLVGNLTNGPVAPYFFTTGNYLLAAAGSSHQGPIQCSKNIPYGLIMTRTIGGPNLIDVDTIATYWGMTGSIPADLSGDGMVDAIDLNMLMDMWKIAKP